MLSRYSEKSRTFLQKLWGSPVVPQAPRFGNALIWSVALPMISSKKKPLIWFVPKRQPYQRLKRVRDLLFPLISMSALLTIQKPKKKVSLGLIKVTMAMLRFSHILAPKAIQLTMNWDKEVSIARKIHLNLSKKRWPMLVSWPTCLYLCVWTLETTAKITSLMRNGKTLISSSSATYVGNHLLTGHNWPRTKVPPISVAKIWPYGPVKQPSGFKEKISRFLSSLRLQSVTWEKGSSSYFLKLKSIPTGAV